MLELSKPDVEFARQFFVVKGADVQSGCSRPLPLPWATPFRSSCAALTGVADQVMSIPSYAYTCAVREMEIDPETGLNRAVRGRCRCPGRRRSARAARR